MTHQRKQKSDFIIVNIQHLFRAWEYLKMLRHRFVFNERVDLEEQ